MKFLYVVCLLLISVVIQADDVTLDETYCDDTWLNESYQDRNYGVSVSLSATSTRHTLIYFDLSSISSSATVDSVCLFLTSYYTPSITFNFDRVLTNWTEGNTNGEVDGAGEYGATFNYANDDFSTPANREHWQDAESQTDFSSADYDDNSGSHYASVTSPASPQTYQMEVVGSDLNALVEDWIDGTYDNYGCYVTTATGTGTILSSENSTEANRPSLYIEYTLVGGEGSGRVLIIQ